MTDSHAERLGTRPVGPLLAEYAAQATFALLVYSAFILTDTYILSVGVGPLAAAGAGIIAPVLLLLGAVSTTVGSGGAALVSRALGQRDPVRAAQVIACALVTFWTVAGTVTLLGAPFTGPLVRLLGASRRTRRRSGGSSCWARLRAPASPRSSAPKVTCGSPRPSGWSRWSSTSCCAGCS